MTKKLVVVAAVALAAALLAILASVTDPGDPAPPDRTARSAPPEGSTGGGAARVEEPDPEPGESAAAESATTVRHAGTRRDDAVALPVADGFRLEVRADGTVALGDVRARLVRDARLFGLDGVDELTEALVLEAGKNRDRDHPFQPSLRAPVIDAGAAVPWWVVRSAMSLVLHPNVRMYRIHWMAVKDGEEVALPVFFAKDRGLARTRVSLRWRPRIVVVLDRGPGARATTVRLLGEEIGAGEAGFAALEARLPPLVERVEGVPVLVAPADDVPLGEVVRALDLVPDADFGNLASGSADLGPAAGLRTALDAGDPLREELDRLGLRFEGEVFGEAGLSDGLFAFLAERLTAIERAELLERVLVPDPGDRPEVWKVLARPAQSPSGASRLVESCRLDERLLLAYGRACLELGRDGDLRRAAALGGLATCTDPVRDFAPTWWAGQAIALRATLRWGEAHEDRRAVGRVLSMVKTLDELGLTDRAPAPGELRELRENAKALDAWLERNR